METPDKYNSIYIMISPTVRCNLSCKYCYVNQNMPKDESDMTLDNIKYIYQWIREYSELIGIQRIRIEWFGGEPFVIGGDFLEKAINLQCEYFPADEFQIHNSIQTNLVLANRDENVSLIKKHFNSYISGSLDYKGDSRIFKNGKDSTPVVFDNIRYLKKNGISVGLVCTLTKSNIGYIDEMYSFFKELGVDFRVNRAAHVEDHLFQSSIITTQEYSDAVIRLFDLYTSDEHCNISFENFDMMVRLYLMGLSDMCVTVTKPYLHLAFEANGRLFSRCRFVPQVGNYNRESPAIILARFKSMSTERVAPQECEGCQFFNKTCMGGCFGEKNKDCFNSDCGYRGETNKNIWAYIERILTSQGYKYGEYRKP